MARESTTQPRTFTYGAHSATSNHQRSLRTGPVLMSANNPENGTVTNACNSDTTLAYKIAAKGKRSVIRTIPTGA